MVATVIFGMLCVHLLCFGGMFLLISSRLHGKKLGMDVFAIGNLMLGSAYLLQLWGGPPGWNLMSVVNHTLTLCAPAVYWLGAMRFFGRPAPLWRPIVALALTYTAAQVLVQWTLGSLARYAMLSGLSALLFLEMTITGGLRRPNLCPGPACRNGAVCHPDRRNLRTECGEVREPTFRRDAGAGYGQPFPDGVLYLHVLLGDRIGAFDHLAGAAPADGRAAHHGGARSADAIAEPARPGRGAGRAFSLSNRGPRALAHH